MRCRFIQKQEIKSTITKGRKTMKINVKKIFNWDIVSVDGPIPVFSVVDNQKKLAGYNVVVDYKYHGRRHFFFDVDSERSWLVFGGPKEEAQICYRDMVAKQIRQIKRRRTGIFNQR